MPRFRIASTVVTRAITPTTQVTECNSIFWLAFFFQIKETEIGRCLWRTGGLDNLGRTAMAGVGFGGCLTLDGRIDTGENTGDSWQKMVAIGSTWPCHGRRISG